MLQVSPWQDLLHRDLSAGTTKVAGWGNAPMTIDGGKSLVSLSPANRLVVQHLP